MKRTILVTGARGQIGSDLTAALCAQHGAAHVLATDLDPTAPDGAPYAYEALDVRDADRLNALLDEYEVGTVYHLASLLSARGEQQPDLSWAVNMDGLKHVLDAARTRGLRVFWPSSIAVFGPGSPRERVPQDTVLAPTTMYGITKVAGELLCRYYHDRFGVDVRSLRYPGIISYGTPPGGGTTDYAVEIFYAAVADESYTCFVRPDTRLPMMYMPDAIRAALDLMAAPSDRISVRTSYNIQAASFPAEVLAEEIRRHLPAFTCRYAPDHRQRIADSWPQDLDDSQARIDWGWQPAYDLPALTEDMLAKLSEKKSLEV